MRNLLYIILFNLILSSASGGQDLNQTKDFADELYNSSNYLHALKEYQRVLYFDEQGEYNEIYSRIASIFYNLSDFESAIRYLNLAHRTEDNDSLKVELILFKALCNFRMSDYLGAMNELLDIPDLHPGFLQKKRNLYLGICHFGLNEYEESSLFFFEILDSEGIAEIDLLFSDFEKFNKRYRPAKVELMSKLLPGLGQIYAGEVFNGINSFLLISGVTVYAVFTVINYGLLDGLILITSWFQRYYSGGVTNAHNFAEKKIAVKKAQVYSNIMTLIENNQIKSLE